MCVCVYVCMYIVVEHILVNLAIHPETITSVLCQPGYITIATYRCDITNLSLGSISP